MNHPTPFTPFTPIVSTYLAAVLLPKLRRYFNITSCVFYKYVPFSQSKGEKRKLVSRGFASLDNVHDRHSVENGHYFWYNSAAIPGPWNVFSNKDISGRDRGRLQVYGDASSVRKSDLFSFHAVEEFSKYAEQRPITAGVWLDVPVMLNKRPIGMISCNCVNVPDEVQLAEIQKHINGSASNELYAELTKQDQVKPAQDTLHSINDIKSLEELYSWCSYELPSIFGAAFGSVFTVSIDEAKNRKLVLRSTSNPRIKEKEQLVAYDLQDSTNSLTKWVALNQVPLRIRKLAQENERTNQLSRIGVNIVWSDTISDADRHESYLACPIQSLSTGLVGVLRLVQKSTDHAFSERDEALLTYLCDRVLAPKFASLRSASLGQHLFSYLGSVKSHAIDLATLDESEFARRVCKQVHDRFSSSDVANEAHSSGILKRVILNKVFCHEDAELSEPKDKMANSLRHLGHYGANLGNALDDESFRKTWPMADTITGYALFHPERPVYIHSPNFAPTRVAFNFCPEAKSVLACDISFGPVQYGTLLVFSHGYDMDADIHGTLLEFIALQCAEFFYRAEVAQQALAGAGLRHDVLAIINHIEHKLEGLVESSEGALVKELIMLKNWNGLARHYIECLTRRSGEASGPYLRMYDLSQVKLKEEINSMCEFLASRSTHNVHFEVDIVETERPRVDQSRLLYTIYNLANNSLKHNTGIDELFVLIAARTSPSAVSNCDILKLYVADNGIGVSDDIADFVNQARGVEYYESVASDPIRSGRKGLALVKALIASYRLPTDEKAQISVMTGVVAKAVASGLGFSKTAGTVFELIIPIPRGTMSI